MLVEIVGDELYFQVVTERGQTIDSGVVRKGTDNRWSERRDRSRRRSQPRRP